MRSNKQTTKLTPTQEILIELYGVEIINTAAPEPWTLDDIWELIYGEERTDDAR